MISHATVPTTPAANMHWQPIPATSWQPTTTHQLLLRVICGTDEAAIAAWQTWVQQIDIEQLDEGSYWLLPRVYQRCPTLEISDPSPRETATWQRLKGVYRHVWSRNQMILRYLGEAVQELKEADIAAVVVGGAALVAAPGADIGSRRADDSGIWVPAETLGAALVILKSLGWRPTLSKSPDQLRAQQTAVGLRRQRDTLTLYWRVLPECPVLGVAGEEAATGTTLTLGHEFAIALSPTDQCFACCIQATRWQPRSPVYWLADAAHLIQQHPIDWARLIYLGRTHQLTLPLLKSLTHLSSLLGTAELAQTCQTLRGIPLTAAERAEFAAKAQPYPLWGQLSPLWFEYRRLTSHHWFQYPAGFAQFLAHRWGLNHSWQVPLHASKQGVQRLLRAVNSRRN
ncbi:nucleotidyltransferase family protein [Halomicronema sp. CCY15110]|uniref:nucleotidyltransferase family protein n=1 Tax=Halomicronema sp. CCY15110 TaxID=2767773 RepID=UPI00194FEFB7|nr:nucleotidyltransferase family protein [Halomicronema sp. CCY15110]